MDIRLGHSEAGTLGGSYELMCHLDLLYAVRDLLRGPWTLSCFGYCAKDYETW